MRTARLLPVSPGMHCSGGHLVPGGCRVYLVLGGHLVWGVHLVRRGSPGRGVPGPRGVYLVPGGVPGPGGCLPRYSPLWTEFLTHASENITLPQTSFAGGNNPMKTCVGICLYAVWTRPRYSVQAFFISISIDFGVGQCKHTRIVNVLHSNGTCHQIFWTLEGCARLMGVSSLAVLDSIMLSIKNCFRKTYNP